MSVDEPRVIDFVVLSERGDHAFLVISDHLDWSDPDKHLAILEEKIDWYYTFVQSGELVTEFPEMKGLPLTIDIRFIEELIPAGVEFLERMRGPLQSAGFSLTYKRLGGSTIH